MYLFGENGPLRSDTSVDDRRNAVRLPQDNLIYCDFGEVIDLSRTGLRARRKSIPTRSNLPVMLKGNGMELTLDAEVVWAQKLGFRKFEIGLRFSDLNEAQRHGLTGLAMFNRQARTL